MAQQQKAETQSSALDTVKLALAVLFLAGALVGFYYYADQPLVFRVPGLLAVLGVSVAIASQTAMGRMVWGFVSESRTEMRKVVWPTRQETVQTTLVVIGLVLTFALLMWGLDFVLLWLVRLLTGQGS